MPPPPLEFRRRRGFNEGDMRFGDHWAFLGKHHAFDQIAYIPDITAPGMSHEDLLRLRADPLKCFLECAVLPLQYASLKIISVEGWRDSGNLGGNAYPAQ